MNPGGAVSILRPFARPADPSVVADGANATQAIVVPALALGVFAIGLRLFFGPQLDGIDDAGYLDAARRVSDGRPLDDLSVLFRTRVGMSYPLGWLVQAGWLETHQFWLLTLCADGITLVSLLAAGWLLTGTAAAGLAAAGLYAIYPLAVQQSVMYQPTSFQVAAIAAAIALLALAERRDGRRRLAIAFAAGVSLGIGYLFKEDVALVVPAIAIAAVVARFPRLLTVAMICGGAALVFAAECAMYWQATGDPLFRLSASSGLGASNISNQLHMAGIWRWDAFLRSLLLLPAQVGIIWWLAIVAVWFTLRHRRPARGPTFIAILFIVVMAYLQFGSGSFSTYSPLPKTPRYSALATPLLMLVTGGWLAMLMAARRRLAVVVWAAVVATAIPCIFLLHLGSSERTRNTLAVLPALESLDVGVLYTDFYSARLLRILEPRRDVRVWYHAKFDTNTMMLVNQPPPGSYVLLDRQSAKVYTSSYGLPLPKEIEDGPRHWTSLWTHRAYAENSLSRRLLESLNAIAARLPSGNPVSRRINRNVMDMIDGDHATLYRVARS